MTFNRAMVHDSASVLFGVEDLQVIEADTEPDGRSRCGWPRMIWAPRLASLRVGFTQRPGHPGAGGPSASAIWKVDHAGSRIYAEAGPRAAPHRQLVRAADRQLSAEPRRHP